MLNPISVPNVEHRPKLPFRGWLRAPIVAARTGQRQLTPRQRFLDITLDSTINHADHRRRPRIMVNAWHRPQSPNTLGTCQGQPRNGRREAPRGSRHKSWPMRHKSWSQLQWFTTQIMVNATHRPQHSHVVNARHRPQHSHVVNDNRPRRGQCAAPTATLTCAMANAQQRPHRQIKIAWKDKSPA